MSRGSKTTMYKRLCLITITAWLLQSFFTVGIAQVSVPIEKEPMHRLKFENEFVRLFDVLIPAGKASLSHTHSYDGLSIRISNAQLVVEIASEKTPLEIKYADATYTARPSPMSHRVVNNGKTDFRNIFIEILPSKGARPAVQFPILSEGHVVLIDNARIRVNRLILRPGQSSKLHAHPMHGLGIILYDSKIEISTPERTKRVIESKAGDFVWQNAGTTHVITNIGSTVFEAIDIEVK